MSTIAPVDLAVSKHLARWTGSADAPPIISVRTAAGWSSIPSTDLERTVQQFPIGLFEQKRFVLAGQPAAATDDDGGLPDPMTWDAAEALVTAAARGGRVELTSWGVGEYQCLMVYGDWQSAIDARLPISEWATRPPKPGPTFDDVVTGIGGWNADPAPLAATFARLPGPKCVVAYTHVDDRIAKLLETSRRTVLPLIRRPKHYLNPERTVLFEDVAAAGLARLFREWNDDRWFTFTLFPADAAPPMTDALALDLLIEETSHFTAGRLLDRVPWFACTTAGENAFYFAFHARPASPDLIPIRHELRTLLGRDECIVW